ncbi:MAG: DEAD/DEAH box helicase [Deltaproteobacteria bacterium]|jgi:ATP-dependent RNA helicase DeaD|nr:DEAD/DEAH box helicase [Deltaproteobacteria bacterium]MBW2505256.1 DEAD/DEAH box helicase [Deltaproteobacteria bacterium]
MTKELSARFEDLSILPALQKVIKELGYETPSPIQAQSIPHLLEGRDLLGQAQTGTGKTAAFALPLLSRLNLKQKEPQILVMTPTRELALQVAEAMRTYARYLKGFHVLPVYGGQNMGHQLRQLARGVHAIVGTPGRIQDHLERGTLNLGQIKAVVLDEADEMLKMGFIDDVERILTHAPQDRQTALFSATMPKDVLAVARRHMVDPLEIHIKTKTTTVETINQRYWQVKGLHKLDALTRILEAEDTDGMIIFVRTKTATVELSEKLEARGFSSAALNGDMTQAMREKTVERLKNGQLDIVVATDVAARGLDVKRISHVVNYDIPYDTESYIHRIGRTGRAGREGQAILFVAPREKRMLASIERATRQTITAMSVPSRKDIADRRVALFNEQLTEAMQSQDLEFFEELIDNYQHEHNTGLRRIAATLAFLLQKDKPLQSDADSTREVDQLDLETDDHGDVRDEQDLIQYRIEVGRQHGVEPRHIVGAIANEGKISSKSIGQIRINQDYCLIDLPANLSNAIMKQLQNVWVCGQRMQISVADSGSEKNSRLKPKRRVTHKKFNKYIKKNLKPNRSPRR